MTFTAENTEGFSATDLATMNAAHAEVRRIAFPPTAAEDVPESGLDEIICTEFDNGAVTVADLASAVVDRLMGGHGRASLSSAAAALGRKGGASTSDAKRAAVRENGKKGGRPKKA